MIRTHQIDGHTVSIEWEQGSYMDKISNYVKTYVMTGKGDDGKEYQGTGEYICGELETITDIEEI